MRISVIGAGYVGLTTASCLAHIGHNVCCGENDLHKLHELQIGNMPIFEPYLESIVGDARRTGQLFFGTTDEAIDYGEAIFICVGTPPLPNGDADLSSIEAVARAIAGRASSYRLIIEKSTVPVQTSSQLCKYLSTHKTHGFDYDLASNPEFLKEGSAVEDLFHPDRIVVGVTSDRALELLREIYKPIIDQTFTCPVHRNCQNRSKVPFLVTDPNSAEIIKHASNSFLAMKISFINMVADLCDAVGADVTRVSDGIGLDRRIGKAFLKPGIGFGGFCFPKDLQAFVRIAEKHGCDFSLLKEVEKINRYRIEQLVEKVRKELWTIRGKKIGVWGLAFKPNTDDVRFAPSISLIKSLLDEGAIVSAHDPQAAEKARRIMSSGRYCADLYEAASDAEAIVIVTEWEQYRHVDWRRLRLLVGNPLIIDGRNMFKPEEVTSHGFRYLSVGRPPSEPVTDVSTPQAKNPPPFSPPCEYQPSVSAEE